MPSKQILEKKYLDKLETRQLWFGTVRKTIDPTRMGRMLVHIPELTGAKGSRKQECHWPSRMK